MKRLLIIGILFASLTVRGNTSGTAGLDSLDHYLSRQSYSDRQKETQIRQIKAKIGQSKEDNLLLYSLYVDLFEEYRSYIYDSAYVCVEKLLDVSHALNDQDKITSSTVKMGFCYLSSGMFKEAFDILEMIDVSGCSDLTKIDYYTCKARLYYDLADYNNSAGFRSRYNEKGNHTIYSH